MRANHLVSVLVAFSLSAFALAQAKSNATPPATKPASTAVATTTKGAENSSEAAAKTPRQVFILSQKGMVGAGLRHEEMDKIEKEADKFGPGQIIILRINSGGGSVTEGDRISKSLTRIRDKHRLVAWIEEAISGAAFTAMHCPEMYLMKNGSIGSITKFSSNSEGQKSAEGKDLEAWIERVAEVSEGGGRNGQVGRAMVYSPIMVSYTKDPKTGKVTFYPDKSGAVVLSDEKDNLTFNCTNALDCGFINGVADTPEELFTAMQLVPGTFQVNETGKRVGDSWNKVLEKAQSDRDSITQDLQLTNGNDVKSMQKRIQLYKQMQEIWKKAKPVAEGMEGGGPLLPPEAEQVAADLFEKWQTSPDQAKVACEAIDRCIKELQKKLAAAKKTG